MTMNFEEYDVDQFLKDEFFVEWVLRPNADSDHFWNNWLSQRPEKREQAAIARELIKKMHYTHEDHLDADEYTLMMENILTGRKRMRVSARKSGWPVYWRVAAVILLALAGAMAVYQIHTAQTETISPLITVVETPYGVKKSIKLPDGTRVMMNSGTQLIYPTEFAADNRTITFKGEAFFEVAKDPKRPFIIQAGDVTTRVLGTSFNIRRFEEDNEISVAVYTGKVAVKTQAGQYNLLYPSDMGIFHRDRREFERITFDKNNVCEWTQGILSFHNEDLRTVFNKLEKWYGVKFDIADDVVLQGKYSGEYKQKSLELVLEGMSYTSNFHYIINQKTIKIYAKKK